MDYAIANWIFNTFGKSKFVTTLFHIVTLFGEWWSICLIVLVLLLFKKTRKIGIYVGVTCLLAFVFNNYILKEIVKRTRPLVAHPEFQQACNLAGYEVPTDYSMASGHSTVSMALACGVFMHSKKAGLWCLPFPILMGFSRMVLCVHYLTDVLAGFLIGISFAVAVFYLINFLTKLYLKRKGENYEKISFSNKK